MTTRSTTAARGPRRALRAQSGVTLVELLAVISIMSIVSTMIILGWSAASQSIAYTSNSAFARDNARFAIGRMTREIRDAQLPTSAYVATAGFPTTTPSIVRARPTWIALFSSFNAPGPMPTVSPRLVVYCLYPDGNLWRYADLKGDGMNNGVSNSTSWSSSISALTNGTGTQGSEDIQTSTWEGASRVVDHVVNGLQNTDLFDYSSYDNNGALVQMSPVLGDQLRAAIVAVQVHVLVDLNPGHSPTYMDLQTAAQLRNAH